MRPTWRNHPTHPDHVPARSVVRARGLFSQTRQPRRRTRQWWKASEVAAELGVTPQLVARWLGRGLLSAVCVDCCWRISAEALEAALSTPEVIVSMGRAQAMRERWQRRKGTAR